MEIIKAEITHLDSLNEIYSTVVHHLRSNKVFQWDSQYPNRNIIKSDLENGSLYGIVDNSYFVGAMVLNDEQETEYEKIQWENNVGKIMVIHRLVVHPTYQGMGVGKKLLCYAETLAYDNSYKSIRLDAYSGNPAALRLYDRHGYQLRGEVFFPRRELPFFCYEKTVLQKP
ncbi:MAG: acetyltransferase [Bacilli bacterium]|nr:acetyltransferase [Bacilli bacterium]